MGKIGLALSTIICALCFLPVRASAAQVPLSPELRNAKSIYFEPTSGELPALDELAKQFKAWKRFEIVDTRDAADLVVTISAAPTGDAVGVPVGGIVVAAQSEAFTFSLRSVRSNQPLWADKEPIGSFSRHGGIKKLVERLRIRLEPK